MNRGKEKPKPVVYHPPVMKYRKDIGKYLVKQSKPEERMMRARHEVKESNSKSICSGIYLSLILVGIWIVFMSFLYFIYK